MDAPLPVVAAVTAECLLGAAGAYLLLRHGRRRPRTAPEPTLPPWEAAWPDFLVFVLCVLAGTVLANAAASVILRGLGVTGLAFTVIAGSGAQLGMLAGVAFFEARVQRSPGEARGGSVVRSGIATFLMALPVLMAASLAWRGLLHVLGIEAEPQDLLGMFRRAGSPLLLTAMIVLAVVIAPVAEELVFRRGLYRYLRTRFPRGPALVVPAVLFAGLHANLASFVPLVVLAVFFSLAYERTGRIGTCIVAHGLFNLNTILLVLSGASDLA